MSSGVVLVAGGQQPLRLHVGLLAPPPAESTLHLQRRLALQNTFKQADSKMSARERRQARCLRSSLHLHSRRQARPGTHALPQADAGRSPMHPTATLRSSSPRQGTMVRHHAQQRNPPLALICRADTQGKNRRSQGPSTLQPPLADDTRRTSRLACPPLRCQHQNGYLSVLAPPKRTRIRSSELMPGRAAPTAPQPQPGRAA